MKDMIKTLKCAESCSPTKLCAVGVVRRKVVEIEMKLLVIRLLLISKNLKKVLEF
jgi:hypothetical protein